MTTESKRVSRCTEPGCTETPTGAKHRNGGLACRKHAPAAELLPIRPEPPPKATDGMISPRAVEGLDETGRRVEGAEDWYYREPSSRMTGRHYSPIVVNNRLMWQQPTPIHVKGVPFASPKVAATVAREISEAQAQRVSRTLLLDGAVADLRGMRASDIREAISRELGTLSARQLKRRARKANR